MDNATVYIDIINNNCLNYWKVTTRLSINNVYNLNANRCIWYTLAYSPKIGYKGIYLGVIDNIHVKKVTINNEECMIEKLKPHLYLWYKFSNKNGFNLKIIK